MAIEDMIDKKEKGLETDLNRITQILMMGADGPYEQALRVELFQ